MSASEELKALDAAATDGPWMDWRAFKDNEPSYPEITSEDLFTLASLRNALPQIVAVVEAAERAKRYLRDSQYLVGADGVLEELAPALTALDEALGGDVT